MPSEDAPRTLAAATRPPSIKRLREYLAEDGLEAKDGTMPCTLTLDYWLDDGWYVGKLREVPGVASQGESLVELMANIQDAYQLMTEDAPVPSDEGTSA